MSTLDHILVTLQVVVKVPIINDSVQTTSVETADQIKQLLDLSTFEQIGTPTIVFTCKTCKTTEE